MSEFDGLSRTFEKGKGEWPEYERLEAIHLQDGALVLNVLGKQYIYPAREGPEKIS